MAERRATLDGSRVFWLFLKFVLLGPALHLMFRPKVTGLEHIPREGGAIVAANHVSFLDPLLLPLVVPRRRVMFLTKVKYIDKPLLRWILTSAGVIPVATDDPRAVGGAVTAAVQAVRSGRLIGIFLRARGRQMAGCTGGRPAWPGSRSSEGVPVYRSGSSAPTSPARAGRRSPAALGARWSSGRPSRSPCPKAGRRGARR